ncbi:MAG TPA: helix-turn-helix transcriptional regulator [Actinophytocola sp.]|uniref:helix-turn-helix domain-containing protein n=1 Tax=Actinophytocola sp. TaxID=1872138 RepID=UPI002DDCA015|nr:helix-turn-helix transcriptional regulator [Actinophytocola sp.]HEV2783787.1 helix-turn-helix transcriptional regulator [Actinophytocola sp.]
MAVTAATPRTRALAAALRRELDASQMGIREIARVLGRSHTTISQWQNGKRVPSPDDVSALLAVIGVTGKRRTEILNLARHAAEPNWLAVGVPGVSQGLAGVIECERTAIEIVEWSPLVVLGLLQTSDYARSILASGGTLARHEVEERVQLRLARQVALTDRKPAPVELVALIGEPALRQVIGGRDLMIAQLRHVLWATELPTVTVQVVPIGEGWHPGLMGPFALYNYDRSPSIVHLEHHRSSAFLYEEGDVTAYKVASATVRRAALSTGDSVAFIAKVINEMERQE